MIRSAAIGFGLAVIGSAGSAGQHNDVARIWTGTQADRDAAVTSLLASDLSFTDLLAALRAGPEYPSDVQTGRRELRHNIGGIPHRYFFVVPDSYTPTRRYPVRFFLHGGVRRAAPNSGGGWWQRWTDLARDDYIAVFPAAWSASPWWAPPQVENLVAILQFLKRDYNIDENRVSVFGVSDGGTGLYYTALKNPQPFAAFLPLIGHPAVLNNPRLGIPGELFIRNLTNRPFFIANARNDHLYPAESMQPFLEDFENAGVDFEFRAQPGGHSVSWWPDEAPAMDAFLEARPRDPHPAQLSWETERTDRYHRFHWLRIDEIDENAPVYAPQGDPFPHDRPSGYATAAYRGNEIRVSSEHVFKLTLLLSPDVFDFSQPVRVMINGRRVFDAVVEPSREVLLKWAARDRDRTMLYGAEITLDVGSR